MEPISPADQVTFKCPIVVVFDMDRTLVGITNPLICFWLASSCVFSPTVYMLLNMKDVIISALRERLARPFIKEFMERLKSEFTDTSVEFFVYTASKKDWALVLIAYMEEAFGITFNRPVFNREEHTYKGLKLLDPIVPEIQSSLIQRYGYIPNKTIKKNMIVFDDNPDMYDEEHDIVHIFKCPSYSDTAFPDPRDIFPRDLLEKRYRDLADFMTNTLSIPFNRCSMTNYKNFDDCCTEIMIVINHNMDHYTEDDESKYYWRDFDLTQIRDKLREIQYSSSFTLR